jgi:DNA-binding CsgD family transcriptional regulator
MERQEPQIPKRGELVSLITGKELETLKDVARGLSDQAIARRHNLSKRGVQSRISSLMQKLLGADEYTRLAVEKLDAINPRCRLVFVALTLELFDIGEIQQLDTQEQQEQESPRTGEQYSNVWVLRTIFPQHS